MDEKKKHDNQSQAFIGKYSPVMIDSLAIDLTIIKSKTIQQLRSGRVEDNDEESSANEDDEIGGVLLASIVFSDDETILSSVDIVEQLCQIATLQLQPSVLLTSSSSTLRQLPQTAAPAAFRSSEASDQFKAFCFPVWVVKVQAAIARRLSHMLATQISSEPELSVLSVQEKQNGVKQNERLAQLNSLAASLVKKTKCPEDGHKNNDNSVLLSSSLHASPATKAQSSINNRVLKSCSNSSSFAGSLLETYLKMTDLLLKTSQLCLFHPNITVQYFAHLTCLSSFRCASVKRSFLLPRIHQVSRS